MISFLTCIFATLFTAEKKIKEDKKKGVIEILKLLPRFFTNRYMKNFLIYTFITNCFTSFYGEALTLKYIINGIDKTTLVNISTMIGPIGLIISCLSNKFMKKDKLCYFYHIASLFDSVISIGSLLILAYLEKTKNVEMAVRFLYLIGIFGTIGDQASNFLMAKVNNIVDEELGSTSITVFTSILNASGSIPTTIGLKIVKYFNFHVFCWIFALLNIIVLAWKFKEAKRMDLLDHKMYQIVSDSNSFRYTLTQKNDEKLDREMLDVTMSQRDDGNNGNITDGSGDD